MAARIDRKNPVVIGAVAAVALFAVLATSIYVSTRIPRSFGRSGIYAVFLANGQVYFGEVGIETDRVLTLTHIYYLNLSKPVLSQDDLQDDAAASLVKLGNELHGPEDRMEIRQSQVLFIERLKPDSKVVKAIEAYKSGVQQQ